MMPFVGGPLDGEVWTVSCEDWGELQAEVRDQGGRMVYALRFERLAAGPQYEYTRPRYEFVDD